MAMVIPFPGNKGSHYVEYHKRHNHFICLYKNSSRGYNDPDSLWKGLGSAKYTETGKALREWAREVFKEEVVEEVARKDTSFASEALDETDPNHNTRTII